MGLSCSGAKFVAHNAHCVRCNGSRRDSRWRRGFILGWHSAAQTSVAERTSVRPIPAAAIPIAPQTTQLTEMLNQREAREVLLDDGQVDSSPTNAPAHPAVVAAVAPSPAQKRSTHFAQRARHRDTVSSSRQAQHSEAPQTAPNVVDRFFTGLTAAIEHARTVRHRITATLATASLNDRYLRSSKMRSRGATPCALSLRRHPITISALRRCNGHYDRSDHVADCARKDRR